MTLAIKSHATRGKEVIEILEMLGGTNTWKYIGDGRKGAYYINEQRNINYIDIPELTRKNLKTFTLDEFLKKFPYKIGNKVLINDDENDVYTIKTMEWDEDFNLVRYKIEAVDGYMDEHAWFADEMVFVNHKKEETMEIKPNQIKNKNAFIDIANAEYNNVNTIELLCSDMFDVEIIHEDKIVLKRKKPQYPKTYDECADMFNCTVETVNLETVRALRELIYCRNAYWKMAGQQMGLDKPWKPENPSRSYIFTIENCGGNIIKKFIIDTWRNKLLIFPTEEMRDAFYENFKELIEVCKDFL